MPGAASPRAPRRRAPTRRLRGGSFSTRDALAHPPAPARRTPQQLRQHRAAFARLTDYDDLREWLATSLESNDLFWPLYYGDDDDLSSLGADSEGGTNGPLMAEIVRRTGLLTTESQDSLVKWDADAPNAPWLRGVSPGRVASAVRTKGYQRAYVALWGPAEVVRALVDAAVTSGLVGNGPTKLVRAFVEVHSARDIQEVQDDGTLRTADSMALTWSDLYRADGVLLEQAPTSRALEGAPPSGCPTNPRLETAATGGGPNSLADAVRAFQRSEPDRPSSPALGRALGAMELATVKLVDVNPLFTKQGGLCAWLARACA